MNPVSNIALSGMNSAQTQLETAAHNIANASTPGFQRREARLQSLPQGGVVATPVTRDEVGSSLETDIVGQMQAKHAFLANLTVFRTADRMVGSLLDASA